MRWRRRREPARIHANLTPMIDVTFLLIVFFVLVSRITDADRVDMALPSPVDAATVPPDRVPRVVVNVLPGSDGAAAGYAVGAKRFPPGPEGLRDLETHLVSRFHEQPSLHVNLRADRGTGWRWVAPVLDTVTAAARSGLANPGSARINLVVAREE